MGAVQWGQRLAERQALGRQSTLRGACFVDSFGMHQVVAETPAHRNLRETRRANHHHHQDVPTAMTTRTHPQDAAASPSSCAWPKIRYRARRRRRTPRLPRDDHRCLTAMAWATIATAGAITFGSIWGTLTRLGLVALNTYDGQSIAPLVWAQALGCLVFGYASHKRSKAAIEGWYAPAFPMITVGFAGSCTSFSTWALDVFQAFSNGEHHDRIGLYSVMDALAQTATTVGMGLAGVWAGRALADAYPLSAIPTIRMHTTAGHVTAVLLGALFWIGSALLCGLHAPFRHVTFALVLCPPGALARWQLSLLNPPRSADDRVHVRQWTRWPLGTFLANILATLVLCGVVTGKLSRTFSSKTSCDALQGLQDGFAGCLSTVSTLIAELLVLRPMRTSFAYLFTSWALAVISCVLLIGVPRWTLDINDTCQWQVLS